jgi:1,4-alpha-glucan branching enzyme
MGTGTHTSYAVRRTKEHLLKFERLYQDIKSNSVDTGFLTDAEYKDNIFPNIDYRVHQ